MYTPFFVHTKIVASEYNISTHIGTFDFTIELINWNDEIPIFEKSVYILDTIEETVGNNVNLINITATDRDVNDKVM